MGNRKEFNELDVKVASGKISTSDYASQYVAVEGKSLANKILVAKELGMTDTGSGGLNKVLEKYSEGSMTKEQVIAIIVNHAGKATVTDDSGNRVPALKYYEDQGKKLQKVEFKVEQKQNKKNKKD